MDDFSIKLTNGKQLRYGENPHQKGSFYKTEDSTSDPLALSEFEFVQGKELSYNNYLDMDGALFALSHMGGIEAGCVIVKHTNPCGAALRETLDEAYNAAWYEGDPLAAFGGVMAVNREVDADLAHKMIENFFELLVAPAVSETAKQVFLKKPNLRVLVNPACQNPFPATGNHMHKVRGGMLIQDTDSAPVDVMKSKVVTKRAPTQSEFEDMELAWAITRSTKSNTVVAVKNKTLVASGAGQQDRKRCAQLCVAKGGESIQGAVAASDGFFPFRDGLDVLAKAGITAVIQPGGSVKDNEVIAAADEAKMAMVFSGMRAFRH